MQNNNTYSDILRLLVTISDRDTFLEQLDLLVKNLYSTSQVASSVSPALSLGLAQAQDKQVYIASLKKVLGDARILSVTLAFDPPYDFLQKVSFWAKQNLGEDVVLEIKINPDIIGGAVFSYGGKFTDMTILKTLNGYLE